MTSRKPIRILAAEDYPANAELLKECLTGGGYQVEIAVNGEEALRLAFAAPPDIILLDVVLPKLDGFEVCRRLKENKATSGIPVLIVTALDSDRDKERGIQAGADDFLNKPLNIFEVLTRVRSLLRVRCLSTDLERALDYIRDLDRGGPGTWPGGWRPEREDDDTGGGGAGVRATLLPRPPGPKSGHAVPPPPKPPPTDAT
ncbi:MAG: response regulator [Planctomycetes bacterium]|nr:response regulator [Planctomycetota bacterium]